MILIFSDNYKGVVKQDETNKQRLREVEGKTSLVFDRLRNNIRQNVWLDGKGKGSFYRQNTEKQIEQTSKEGLEESSSFNLQKTRSNKKVGLVTGADNSTSQFVLEPTSVDTVNNVSILLIVDHKL